MKKIIDHIIVVEGKYDKIKLESLVDAVVIATDGFGIFKDRAAQQNIKKTASLKGAIILSDSDRAGFIIRKYLHDLLHECEVFDVYIPDLYGKEKRKAVPSAEGKLGVEGMPPEVLCKLLDSFENPIRNDGASIKTADLYEWGLFGGEESARKRRSFQHHLGLPGRLNKNMLLKCLNTMFTKEQCVLELNKCFN